MLFESWFPYLPLSSNIETLVYVVASIGAILMIYSIFLDIESRQDLVMMIGASCLLVFALFLHNIIFAIAMGGVATASLFEFVEIYLGIHKHQPFDFDKVKRVK